MKTQILPTILLTVCCVVFFCGVYTVAVWGIAQFAPNNGKGEIVSYHKNGKLSGFRNVGQSFTSDDYFWSRPSAVMYNAAGSAGSNKGPSNPDYLLQVQARIDTFLVHNPGIQKMQIPSELVTASGSGLDPHLSSAAALIQIPRIARSRHISQDKLRTLVNTSVEKPLLGLFGPSRVNVLLLNNALDDLQ